MESKAITPDVSIGAQPQAADIQQLARDGVKTVINLRVDNETHDQLSPLDEAQMVRDAGMEYLHIPVIGSQVREGQVDEFCNAVEKLPKPIFVHCAKGKRAAALAVMNQARQEGWSGKKTLAQAEAMGYPYDDPNMAKFASEYVESRRQ